LNWWRVCIPTSWVCIDHWVSNVPVLKAEVEVEFNGRKAMARFHADHGDYAVADATMLKALHAPGEHALIFSIVTGPPQDNERPPGGQRIADSRGGNMVTDKGADLLTGSLHVEPPALVDALMGASRWRWMLLALGIVVLMCGVWGLRQWRNVRKEKQA
jgi:hypothetical protein